MNQVEAANADWKQRVLAVLFYFGLAPWLWRVCLRGERRFLKHHFAQALTLSLLLLGILLLWALAYAVSSSLLIRDPEAYRSLSQSALFRLLTGGLLHVFGLLWLTAWGASTVLAALGSCFAIPVIGWLSRRKGVISASFVTCSPVYLGLLVLAGAALRASGLVEHELRPAPVYMLYDDMGYVPRWVFDLGFSRVSRAAKARWGRGNVVVVPLSEESLSTAFENGRFVFVASHGGGGRIVTKNLTYGPEDAKEATVGPDLQLVYIAACESGEQAESWEDVLAPAQVISFERKSRVREHVFWLWSEGPSEVYALR